MAATEKPLVFKSESGYYTVKTPKPGMDDRLTESVKARGFALVGRARSAAPSMSALEKMSENGVAKATDGCRVEPDGVCQHGHPSWMLAIGVI